MRLITQVMKPLCNHFMIRSNKLNLRAPLIKIKSFHLLKRVFAMTGIMPLLK